MNVAISFKNQNIKLSYKFRETSKKQSLNLIEALGYKKICLYSLIHSKPFPLEKLKSEVLRKTTKTLNKIK